MMRNTDYKGFLSECSSPEKIFTHIQLVKQAKIDIVHTDGVLKTDFYSGKKVRAAETLRGKVLAESAVMYNIAESDGETTFATLEEIREQGELTPHTRQWLGLQALTNYNDQSVFGPLRAIERGEI